MRNIMKNKIMLFFGKTMLFLLFAGALSLASCSEEEFSRNIGTAPDGGAMQGTSAELYRPAAISNILKVGDNGTSDILRIRLSQSTDAAVSFTVAPAADLLETYNAEHGTDYGLFPVDKTSFGEAGGTLLVAVGNKESDDLTVTFLREGVEKGMYLLPVRATVNDNVVSAPENRLICYYRIVVADQIPESELDTYSFKTVGYINTESVNPLLAAQFSVYCYDMLNDVEATKTWIDIVPLRKANIKLDANGRASLDLGIDLQYVMNNRETYILPLQKSGRKVLICIQGGGNIGFRNLTDSQIADFVYQIKYAIDRYEMDGVNFMDVDVTYDDKAAAVIPSSYAKLIKATKEALGTDKLVTIACDAASTDDLAVAQEGIEAGQYIDYAWSGIFDKIVDAYADGAELKPIAGLDRSKWGSLMFDQHTDSEAYNLQSAISSDLKTLYFQNSESANIFAFYDMPISRSGVERGPGQTFMILLEGGMLDENLEYDGMLYDLILSPEISLQGYGQFAKDW